MVLNQVQYIPTHTTHTLHCISGSAPPHLKYPQETLSTKSTIKKTKKSVVRKQQNNPRLMGLVDPVKTKTGIYFDHQSIRRGSRIRGTKSTDLMQTAILVS